jgi:hypothetical protein
MLRDGAAGQAAGGVAVQLRMQRARARMQTDELMVKHFEDIGRDLQWVLRSGGGDQTLKDAAVGLLRRLTNREEFQRRESAAGTSRAKRADMMRKLSMFVDMWGQVPQGDSGSILRAEFERVMQELQSSCPAVIRLWGDNAGDVSCCRKSLSALESTSHPAAANMLSDDEVANLARELLKHSGLQEIILSSTRVYF